jgi:hypothetical protein
VALDQPAFVVGPSEVNEGEAELLDGPDGPDPEQVLLQRADEALGAAGVLGGADEGPRRGGAGPRRFPSGSRATCTGCRGRGGWRDPGQCVSRDLSIFDGEGWARSSSVASPPLSSIGTVRNSVWGRA